MEKLKQIQPMKGRSATKIEVEAMGAICKLQDKLHDAETIIQSLLGADPHDILQTKAARRKAIKFLNRG